MRDFSKVSPLLWDSHRFRALADDSAQLALLYLLTNRHQNSIGCYRLPPEYACADLGWDAAKYPKALDALVRAGLIEVDLETREVLIVLWFRHNPPCNVKHHTGACRLVEQIASKPLRKRTADELEAAWQKWQADHFSARTPSNGALSSALAQQAKHSR